MRFSHNFGVKSLNSLNNVERRWGLDSLTNVRNGRSLVRRARSDTFELITSEIRNTTDATHLSYSSLVPVPNPVCAT